MRPLYRLRFSFLVLVPLLLAAPAASRLPAGRPARLGADTRLRRPIRVEPAAARVRDLAAGIAKATGARLAVQPDLGLRNLLAAWRSLPAADALRALAVATGGEWLDVARARVLTDQPQLLGSLIALPQEDLFRSSETFAPSLHELSPRELGLLAKRGVLLPEQMSPPMRQTLLWHAQRAYLLYPGYVAPEALQLDGVFLATAPFALPGYVDIEMPRENGDGYESFTSMPYETFRFGSVLKAGPVRSQDAPPGPWVPRRRGPRPAPRRLRPGRPAAEEARFAGDARLDQEITLDKRDVAGAFHAVAAGTALSLIAATAFQERDTRIEHERTTVREAMTGIERATGGAWRVVGGGYALQPDDRLERLALLRPLTRAGARQAAFAGFQAALTAEDLRRLRSTKALAAEKLKRRERERLEWAAAVAFATLPKIGSEALELKGVSIRLLPAEPDKNVPPRVEYALPGISGGAEVAAQVPIQPQE